MSSQRTVVYLMRHGEVHNPDRILYGRLPGFVLSDLGHRMADMVAEHLASRDITHVVASPLERAQQTATPVAASHDLDIHTDERVIEAANKLEGQPVAGGQGMFRLSNLPLLYNPFRPSWGEPYTQIRDRMLPAIEDARDAARGHGAVIVSHQLPIWTARQALEGNRLWHDPRNRECTLASLTTLVYSGDDLVSVAYSEPAGSLLPLASKVAGA